MPFRQPAEWMPHDAVWIGFPSHSDLWRDDLAPARDEVIAFARAVQAGGRGERVILVVADGDAAVEAARLAGGGIAVEVQPFGDIWLRDTGPIVTTDGRTSRAALFRFNGWGGKYDLPGDDTLGTRLAATRSLSTDTSDWVLEGGAIEVDGTGLAVTTEQCLLNPNRNPDFSRAEIEHRLATALGIDHVLWLGDGLANDHTDGHVDNLARFVGEGRLLVPEAASPDDPNAFGYADAAERARAFGLEVLAMPSPGLVERDGEIVPASYMNFYIGNAAVVVPLYGTMNDGAAVERLAALFPTREVIGLGADHILTGGGSFHCISQQIPRIG